MGAFAAVPAYAEEPTTQQVTTLPEQLQRTLSGGSTGAVRITATSPAAGSRANGTAARVVLFNTEVLVIGDTKAKAGNDSSADATVLSVLGNEVIGSHSTANGGSSNSTTGLAHELCDITDGSLCLALLYGEANSSDSGGTSSSSAYTALAAACVNGDQKDPDEDCTDPFASAAFGEGRSTADNDSSDGTTTGSQETTVARLCISDDSSTTACDGVGAVLLRGSNTSSGSSPEPAGFSFQAGGEERYAAVHPGPIGDCTDEGGSLCVLFNTGSTESGTAATADPVIATGGTSTAHAEGFVLRLVILGEEALRASSTEADTRSGQSSADATVLSVLGHEVIGAHAQSSGGSAAAETGYLTETCEESNLGLCLALLYGSAMSQDSTTASSGQSDTALGSACLGGSQARPEENCDGSVGVTVAESHSRASQNKTTGAARATESETGVDVCLGGENDEGTCEGLGIVVLDAYAESNASPGTQGTSTSDASIVTVETGGEDAIRLDQEGEIAIPPGCPVDASLLCLVLNQTDTSATAGSAGAGATVIDLVGIPRGDGEVVGGTGSDAATSASAEPRTEVRGVRRAAPKPKPGLAATGVPVAILVLMAVGSIAAGAVARRRGNVLA